MLALLRRLEWSAPCPSRGDGWYECPECKASAHTAHMEHYPTCVLASAIRSMSSQEAGVAPTDPRELAAWLYERIVPGQTIVESSNRTWRIRAAVESVLVDFTYPWGLELVVPRCLGFKLTERGWAANTGEVLLSIRNPDGTVLWGAK